MTKNSLHTLQFDNRFLASLPADTETENFRRQVENACYSFVTPRKASSPTLIAYSPEMAHELGIDEKDCTSDLFTNVFVGNEFLDDMKPYAQCYAGHQFGNWAGQLGDGRAINLGEVITNKGAHWAIQLKGSGETPYSRQGDGLAVLRSSIREFICSEAMFHLGVPTTRALSIVTTGDEVTRDMFYDGRPKQEPGAVVCRVAPSFLRFGSYELFSSRGDTDNLKTLVDFTINTEFAHLGEPSKDVYLAWFNEVCDRTADLIIHWMRIGFVHGVLNTDNMSVLGLTIDYGPYGWIDNYDTNWTPNTTDAQGKRYAFGKQAQIAHWNLFQLANALYPLIEEAEPLQDALSLFAKNYHQKWQVMHAQKLGLVKFEEADASLVKDLQQLLQSVETDMTLFYRYLANIPLNELPPEQLLGIIDAAFYSPEALTAADKKNVMDWLKRYQNRLQKDGLPDEARKQNMNSVNPKYVFRNYLAQQAIDKAEQGDNSMVEELLEVFRHPYAEQPEYEHYAVKRPDWARTKAGCSMLSCSS
jgi:uncharacterized protein YdiU (UPF0061 family)